MEPGLHPNITADMYHALPHCSNSRLTALHDGCPKKVRYAIDNPSDPTPALILGTAAHVAILEPHAFDALYCVAGRCCATKSKGDGCDNPGKILSGGRWLCGVHAKGCPADADSRIILSPADYESVLGMQESVLSDQYASGFLAAAKEREISVVWDDADTGMRCKARVDALSRSRGVVPDLKTTTNAGDEFDKAVDNFGYARQAAFYVQGLAAHGIPITDFVIIAVEKEPPYCVGVHRITEEAIELASKQLIKLKRKYHECQQSGVWPGYQPRDASLPAWAVKKIELAANAA